MRRRVAPKQMAQLSELIANSILGAAVRTFGFSLPIKIK